jgi:hypothetical protein
MNRLVLALLLVALGAVLVKNSSESVFGADRSGYMNLARMLDRGETTRPLPAMCPDCDPSWFTPLGFVAAPDRRTMASFYPIGLPLHLLAAARLGGWSAAPFFLSPLAGLLLVLFTFLLGRRMHSELAGVIAAVLMGLCAVFVFQSLQVMSDTLAAMWSVAAVVAALEGKKRPWLHAAAGFAFGMAVLVRPTSLLLLPALALALGGMRPALRFLAGGAPCAALLAWYNLRTFGAVAATGYGAIGLTREFALSYFPARAAHYLRWTVIQFSAVGVAAAVVGAVPRLRRFLGFLGVPRSSSGSSGRWSFSVERNRLSSSLAHSPSTPRNPEEPRGTPRNLGARNPEEPGREEPREAPRSWVVLLWFAPFFLFYTCYFSYDQWWYTRFLLPAYPALAVAAGMAFAELKWRRVAIAVVIFVAAWQVRQVARLGVLHTDEDQGSWSSVYRSMASLPPSSLVFCSEHSGGLVYSTTHRPIRFDLAPAGETLAFARASGAPVYALLTEDEQDPFFAKYGPAFRRVRTFEGSALFVLNR